VEIQEMAGQAGSASGIASRKGLKVTQLEKTLDIVDFVGIVPCVVKDSLLA